jgi:glycerol-3-phosphate acyltransferase PlsY
MLELGFKFTMAYLLGSVLGGVLVGYAWGGVDIRKVGSGNPGGTNALRTQGKWFALCVMIVDVGKGVVAITLLPMLVLPGVGLDPAVPRELVLYSVAFAAILGHVFPLWFDFKGGKGGATAAGLLIVLVPTVAPVILGIWLAIAFLTGYVGLATMSAAAAAAVVFAVARWPDEPGLVVFGVLVTVLIIYTHRGNIRRMVQGTESRFRHKRPAERDT